MVISMKFRYIYFIVAFLVVVVVLVKGFVVTEPRTFRMDTDTTITHHARQSLLSRLSTRLHSNRHNDNDESKTINDDMDAMIIRNVAQFCLASESNDECSVEDKDALIYTLQQEQQHENSSMEDLDLLLKRLRISRDNTPASRDRIDALIQSIEMAMSDRIEETRPYISPGAFE